MAVHPLVRPLGLASAVCGIIQGVGWLAMSLLGILMRTEMFIPEFKSPTYSTFISQWIYNLYILDDAKFDTIPVKTKKYGRIITSQALFICMVLYMVLSIAWIITSSLQFYYLSHNKWLPIKRIFMAWCTVTTLITILDVAILIPMIIDYNAVESVVNFDLKHLTSTILLSVGIVMSIIARGYLLLLVNIILAVVLMKFIFMFNAQGDLVEPPVNAFRQPEQSTWFTETRNDEGVGPKVSHINAAFISDPEYITDSPTPLYRSQSFHFPNRTKSSDADTTYDYLASYNNYNRASSREFNRKPSRGMDNLQQYTGFNRPTKTPPQVPPRIPPPIIPEPDYTPPSSPSLPRSVLKSQYKYT